MDIIDCDDSAGCVYMEISSYAHIDGAGSGEIKKLIFLLPIYYTDILYNIYMKKLRSETLCSISYFK